MKSSKYNIINKLDTGEYLVFNSRNCALIVLNDDYMNVLDSLSSSSETKGFEKIIEDLKSVGLVIDNNEDEIELLKFVHNRNKFSKDTLSLTIAPTLDCNFGCPYCFENKRKGKMPLQVQEKLIKVIKNSLCHACNLEITWYGGEPLLALDVIENLYGSISKLVDDYQLNFKSYMITNGYLINEKIVNRLKLLNINTVQITLDGPPEIHNKRRIKKNGDGDTFEKILNGIKLLSANSIDVVIRVNIDRTNYASMEDFLNILVKENLRNIRVTFAQVLPYTEECNAIIPLCFEKKEYADIIYDLQLKLNEKGFKYDKLVYPQPKCVYCSSITLNSFLIDAEGFLYKCWCDVGNERTSFANILEMEDDEELSNSIEYNNNIKYINYSPFNNKECLDCKILPICMGGCPKIAMENQEQKACDFWKYNISKMLKYIYFADNKENC